MEDKVKNLTPMQQAFLSALGGDAKGNIRQAMKLAGYSDNTRIEEVINPLSDEILLIANKLLAANSVKAVVGLVDVFDNPAKPGSNNIIAAAKELMDRAGIIKKEANSGTTIKADNVFILPPKDSVDSSE